MAVLRATWALRAAKHLGDPWGNVSPKNLAAEWLEDVGIRLLVLWYANFSVEMFALSGLWVYVYVYIYMIYAYNVC